QVKMQPIAAFSRSPVVPHGEVPEVMQEGDVVGEDENAFPLRDQLSSTSSEHLGFPRTGRPFDTPVTVCRSCRRQFTLLCVELQRKPLVRGNGWLHKPCSEIICMRRIEHPCEGSIPFRKDRSKIFAIEIIDPADWIISRSLGSEHPECISQRPK